MNRLPEAGVYPEVEWKFLLESASVEVVQLMAGIRLKPCLVRDAEPKGDIVSIVGMAGALCGMMVVRCSASAARKLGLRMLMDDDSITDAMICDAVGEICNMIAGDFKARIENLSDGCKLSVPTVISGDDFRLRGVAADNSIQVVLTLEEDPIWITLMIRS